IERNTQIHREAGRSPRREAAPVAVRAANYVDVITKIAPQLRGLFMVDVDAMWTVLDINPFISSG
ncbi:hypothetical protein PU06_26970, partial [Escherichia coli]